MAAKIKKGDKVVVLAGRDKGRRGEVTQRSSRAMAARSSRASTSSRRHTSARRRRAEGRHHLEGSADPPFQPRDRRPQGRQADARGLQGFRRRPQGPLRQAFRRSDRWLRPNDKGAQGRRRPPTRAARLRPGRSQGQGPSRADRSRRPPARSRPRRRTMSSRLKAQSTRTRSCPKLVKEFGYKNQLEVPKIDKIVLNMGVGEAVNDTKKVTSAANDLALIAGQKPIITRARKAISTFKVRENMPIGAKVTLAQDAHVRVPRPPGDDRAAARARLPRPRPEVVRRARQLRARHQGAHRFPRNRLRQGGSRCWVSTSWSARPPRPTTRRARCCAPSTSRSGSERVFDERLVKRGIMEAFDGKEKRDRE